MASMCLSTTSASRPLVLANKPASATVAVSSSACQDCCCSLVSFRPMFGSGRLRCSISRSRKQNQVVCMAPEEEKLTRRNPLDFPIEWERPKPGRRPDIFPQFSPMKTPIPPPLPYDPPEEDEEEEEDKKKKEEEEEEEKPEKEDQPDIPEQ